MEEFMEEFEEEFEEQFEEEYEEKFEEDYEEKFEEDFEEKFEEDFEEKFEEDFEEKFEEDFEEKFEEDFEEKFEEEDMEEKFEEDLEEKFEEDFEEKFEEDFEEKFEEDEKEFEEQFEEEFEEEFEEKFEEEFEEEFEEKEKVQVEEEGKTDEGVDELRGEKEAEKEEEKEMIEVHEVKKDEFILGSGREEDKSAQKGTASLPATALLSPLQSMADLEKFHGALTQFLLQWKSLNESFTSISAAIDALSQHAVPLVKHEKNGHSELQTIVDMNSGKALRKYIAQNLEDLSRLRCEVSEALRGHHNPGKLVLEGVGRFYTQSKHNSIQLATSRRASILLLEFFVLSGRTNDDASLKKEAYAAALTWRRRIIFEGLETASALDSLGLILFLACYGIPKEFSFNELCHLLRNSDMEKMGNVFRRSSILVEKIPAITKALIKEEKYVEAADLSCGFGLEDTFPPLPLLSSFVRKVKVIGKIEQRRANGSPKLLRESDMEQLKALKSVTKFVEDHKLNLQGDDLLSIPKKILQLENFISRKDEMLAGKTLKRKAEHLNDCKNSETQSRKSFRSSSETSVEEKEQGFLVQPQLPNSIVHSSSLPEAVNYIEGHPYGWNRTFYDNSTGYRSLGMECPMVQNFYQPQAPSYGNAGGIFGRYCYPT